MVRELKPDLTCYSYEQMSHIVIYCGYCADNYPFDPIKELLHAVAVERR